jgi:hypothetical protein
VVEGVKKSPFYKKPVFIAVAAIIALSVVANTGHRSEKSDTTVVTSEESKSAGPNAAEATSPSARPTALVESPSPEVEVEVEVEDPNSFYRSAQGDLRDMIKDLNDMVQRANGRAIVRLLGNTMELSFNVGQLEATNAPQSIAARWKLGVTDLSGSVVSLTSSAGDFASSDISLAQMIEAIDKVRAKVHALEDLAASAI